MIKFEQDKYRAEGRREGIEEVAKLWDEWINLPSEQFNAKMEAPPFGFSKAIRALLDDKVYCFVCWKPEGHCIPNCASLIGRVLPEQHWEKP